MYPKSIEIHLCLDQFVDFECQLLELAQLLQHLAQSFSLGEHSI
jgi:hypothetical protein